MHISAIEHDGRKRFFVISYTLLRIYKVRLSPSGSARNLVHIHPLAPQVLSRHVNLLHQLCVRGGDIVEREDAVAELKEEICAEGDEGPEWELWVGRVSLVFGRDHDIGYPSSESEVSHRRACDGVLP